MLEKNESGNEKTLCEMKHLSNVAMLEMGKKIDRILYLAELGEI